MRCCKAIALACVLLCGGLGAEVVDDTEFDEGVEGSPAPTEELVQWGEMIPHVGLLGNGLYIGKAHFRHRGPTQQKIGFVQLDGTGSAAYHFSGSDALIAQAGYIHTRLDWNENPIFGERNFVTGQGGLAYVTSRVCDWLWRLGGTVSVDTSADSWGHGAQYGWTIWGRYRFTPRCTLHTGVMGLNGLHRNHTWPILGPEVALTDHWQINAVYPIDMSIQYRWEEQGSTGISLRPLLALHRANQDQRSPGAVFQYRNFGVEYFVRKAFRYGIFRISGGIMTGGELKIWNSNHHRLKLLKFRDSGYGQASLGLMF